MSIEKPRSTPDPNSLSLSSMKIRKPLLLNGEKVGLRKRPPKERAFLHFPQELSQPTFQSFFQERAENSVVLGRDRP